MLESSAGQTCPTCRATIERFHPFTVIRGYSPLTALPDPTPDEAVEDQQRALLDTNQSLSADAQALQSEFRSVVARVVEAETVLTRNRDSLEKVTRNARERFSRVDEACEAEKELSGAVSELKDELKHYIAELDTYDDSHLRNSQDGDVNSVPVTSKRIAHLRDNLTTERASVEAVQLEILGLIDAIKSLDLKIEANRLILDDLLEQRRRLSD